MFDSRRVFAFSCELDSVGSFDDACTAILSRVKIKHGCVASPTPSFSGVVTHPLLLLAQSTSGESAFASVCDNGEKGVTGENTEAACEHSSKCG